MNDAPSPQDTTTGTIETIRGANVDDIQFKHFDLLLAATCVIVVCSNIIGAGKVADIGGFSVGAAVLFYPLSYVLGDVLTEVYGYKRARRAIIAATASAGFAAFMAAFVTAMPPHIGWNTDLGGLTQQQSFALNFGQAPRIVAASCLALFAGEIANAQVMTRMKVRLENSPLWQRTIGSTAVGQAVDSLIFYPLAFLGVWETSLVISVMITNYALKVLWEVFLTPVTYRAVAVLKQSEGVDVYDSPDR